MVIDHYDTKEIHTPSLMNVLTDILNKLVPHWIFQDIYLLNF